MRKIQSLFYDKLKNFYKTDYVEEYQEAIDLTIHTKAPGKWLLVDMETGQKYVGSPIPNKYGKWIRLDNLIIE
jgi:hypothetical protein